MTADPHWPEVEDAIRNMKGGSSPATRADIVLRVFKGKLDMLLEDLTKKHVLGRCVGHVAVVEWQKRGQPHAHVLLILHKNDRAATAADVDRDITCKAELKKDLARGLFYQITTAFF